MLVCILMEWEFILLVLPKKSNVYFSGIVCLDLSVSYKLDHVYCCYVSRTFSLPGMLSSICILIYYFRAMRVFLFVYIVAYLTQSAKLQVLGRGSACFFQPVQFTILGLLTETKGKPLCLAPYWQIYLPDYLPSYTLRHTTQKNAGLNILSVVWLLLSLDVTAVVRTRNWNQTFPVLKSLITTSRNHNP